MRLEDRPQFFAQLLPELTSLRSVLGRPHVVIVDEAHHMLPSQWDPGTATLPQGMEGFLFISTQPEAVSPRLLKTVTRLLIVGKSPQVALGTFCPARELCDFDAPAEIELGKVLAIDVAAARMESLKVIPGKGHRLRHMRKYAEGELGDEKSFWFRGPEGKLQLRAQNLIMFLQMADGVDADTWQFHRNRRDYSRWFDTAIKDRELAEEAAAIEVGDASADEARKLMREAIERRYTLPG